MSLLDTLRALGDRLGVLEVPQNTTPSRPAKVQTRTVTLSELTTEIRAEEVHELAQLPAELSVAFEKIFESAGVKPPARGWTVERLGQLLRTEQFKGMDRQAAQNAILKILSSEKVDVEELVRDAIARDQALDAFAASVQKKIKERMATRERRMVEMDAQIRALEEQRKPLKEEAKRDEQQWRQWRERKRAQEKDMAWAIGFLIDRPVVTIDEDSPAVREGTEPS